MSKGVGYGIEAEKIDGNNILEVYDTMKRISNNMRKDPKPFILECKTFRMRGHEESSGTKYIPDKLFDEWGKKDPVVNYEGYLIEKKLLSQNEIEAIKEDYKSNIEEAIDKAFGEADIIANEEEEINDVYYAQDYNPITIKTENQSEKRFIEAISDSLYQAMERDERVLLMGQDIAEYGGVFKVTKGFLEKFGSDRVRNTPIIESGVLGAALGLSVEGYKPIVEMQFSDFVTCGFNQIVNNFAKLHYRWGQKADVLVRMPTGAGVGAGPFHSQSTEGWFLQTPGLKIVYPSSPSDAKGLLTSSIEEPNPVLFFEHKALYRKIRQDIYDDEYSIELGKGKVVSSGNELSIITYGYGVHWALEAKEKSGYDIEIIDLRTLIPYDKKIIEQTISKTNKVLLLQEDTITGGIMAELAAYISEELFHELDAPVVRVASLDTPVPFTDSLESQFLPNSRLMHKIEQLIKY